ncbi:hypothetical protein [Ornithinimicrobium sp. W1665]|uniref:hypothetical protein n=1 Tax=Ornithinimicrobium sp. W1665 TaxID=3416666 RepID=UPI003D6B9A33
MQVRRGIRDYPAVGVVLLTALVGIVLEVTGPPGAARWVVSAVALGIAALQLRGMVADLRAGTYGVDVLAVTAVVSTVAVGEYWAALVVCLMLTGGEALEDYASARAGRELTSLLERAPSVALRELDGGGTERVDWPWCARGTGWWSGRTRWSRSTPSSTPTTVSSTRAP